MVPTIASREPMNPLSSRQEEPAGHPTCLSCHTEDPTITHGTLKAGADWVCHRCGQRWDATRLATVAAYGVWDSERTASFALTPPGSAHKM